MSERYHATQRNIPSEEKAVMLAHNVECLVTRALTLTLTHLTQLLKIHKEFQFPAQDT